MSNDSITFKAQAPRPEEFSRLRADCGWGTISVETAKAALANSVLDLCCFDGERLIGMGRVVGDGVLYFYLQDIIVHAEYQNRAIGRRIVEMLLDEVRKRAEPGATIGLMSAQGKEAFYQHFGFEQRPNDRLGAGMTQFIL
ncbi:GNAT family N-acetyltransferase [Planktotalea sp.]|uniref:GNAT family N-acetyltransferase n=1 Tax=Planktotalea sp. TaxID=2029877 RepID=UPI00329A074E